MSLEKILRTQAELQESMGSPMGQGEVAIKENVLAAQMELCELLSEVNWKPWRKTKFLADRGRTVSELCDVLQFWANIANELGVTESEVMAVLEEKWKVNLRRASNAY